MTTCDDKLYSVSFVSVMSDLTTSLKYTSSVCLFVKSRVTPHSGISAGSHQNCDHDFDGNGGEIAHSWHIGNMHFDDEENYKSINSPTWVVKLLVIFNLTLQKIAIWM